MYKAAYEKKLDVISGYSTDGRLKAFDLVVLDDDKKIFPPYYAVPLIRNGVLKKYPEIESAVNMLSGRINDSIMTELNYEVDYLKQSPEKVARNFLLKNNLFRQARGGRKATIRLGSKIFGEQYILINMYAMLIKGYTDLNVETKTGLGGTKICFDALTNNQIDMYPEYTGTGLLAILNAPSNIVNHLTKNKDSVYDYVSDQFKQKYGLVWLKPIGFNNAYALMMRRQQSNKLNIHSITELTNYVNSEK
jgi:osmoprotectant transport system permease protein